MKCPRARGSGRLASAFSNSVHALALGAALTASDAEAAGSGGASTEQSLNELEARHREFESFGWPPEARFGNDNAALNRYVDFNRDQWTRNRITWLVAPTLMFQQGTQGGPHDSTANYQHNILFAWRPITNSAWGTGTFVFNFLEVYQISDTTGVDMTGSLGLNYPISDSVTDSSSLKALYWQQDFPNGAGDLKLGHIELNGIVTNCRYMCDDTQSFIAGPLSTNVASTMAGQGWGVQAGIALGGKLKLEFGATDAKGDGKLNLDRGLSSNELAYAAALSASDLFPELGGGNVRLAAYSVDPTQTESGTTQASTRGFVFGAEQDVGDVGLSLRYARADGRVSNLRHTGAASVVWKKPFGLGGDWLGFGVGYVQPSEADTEREYLSEVYYRMQLTPLTQFTAGAILAARPNAVIDTGSEAIFNLRLRAAF